VAVAGSLRFTTSAAVSNNEPENGFIPVAILSSAWLLAIVLRSLIAPTLSLNPFGRSLPTLAALGLRRPCSSSNWAIWAALVFFLPFLMFIFPAGALARTTTSS